MASSMFVVANHEGQYSIWPAGREVAAGGLGLRELDPPR
jgi:uncharacterized protein YbdZ (MbtH family)